MPNWCEGTLKIRGTIGELKKFVMNTLNTSTATIRFSWISKYYATTNYIFSYRETRKCCI